MDNICLRIIFICQANARQRKGRAGRTRAGVCFHLFSRRRHGSLPEFQDSELLRMSLEDVLLQTKTLGLAPGKGNAPDSLQGFLGKALDPPLVLSVQNSIQMLQMIGCLDTQEGITTLGNTISQLPLDPRIGRFVLLGCLCGTGPAAVLTACGMGYRDPFIMPANDHQKKLCNKIKFDLAQGLSSDQMSLLNSIVGYSTTLEGRGRKQAEQYCDEKMISRSTMTYLKDLVLHLGQAMKEIGISPNSQHCSRNNSNPQLIMSLIGIGLYPDLGVRRKGTKVFTTEKGRKAVIHPASINARHVSLSVACKTSIELLGYQDLVSTANNSQAPGSASLLMLNTTPVSVLALLLTCGLIRELKGRAFSEGNDDNGEDEEEWEDVDDDETDVISIEIDGWLRLRINRDSFELICLARERFHSSFELFVSGPANILSKEKMKDIEMIVRALCIEQTSTGR